ncbi:hypothetical protein BOX15_Mlig025712g2 [Macrostomum lignano]|uniref:Death domain-containing protein n=1 Tax=Macrostomum lignano TaxID=282301 RepID=A0A267G0C4_9PLAT|nr:hypothetical protein BOX15_Mlig025712g2 [Macrostomum lignano]
MPPALSQQPASWKELIDNGNLALTSGDQNDNENSTAVIHVSSQGADPLSPSWSSSASSSSAGSLLGGTDLLPVYCGLLGCLILGLVAWILVKQMLRRAGTSTTEEKAVAVESALRQQHQPEHEHQEPEHQEQLVLFQFPLTAANSSGCRRPKRRSADSGFGGSEPTEDNILVDGRRLLRELSGSRMQRLENILANDADPDRWRRLASELGLTPVELSILERQALRGGNQLAIREMLHTWSRRPSASIAHLARCLRGVGRSDALILFRESPLKSNRRQHRIVRMHKRQREERLTGQDEAAAAAKQPQQQREEEEDPDEKEKPEQNEAVPAIEHGSEQEKRSQDAVESEQALLSAILPLDNESESQ